MYIKEKNKEGGEGKGMRNKILYMSPMKALTEEKHREWLKRYPDKKISVLTGDYYLTKTKQKELSKADIILCTSEMVDSRTRKMKSERNYWLHNIGLLIVDEAHLLTTSRGHAIETGIIRFTSINNKAKILFLSATMPNVNELGKWLTSLNGKDPRIIYSNWRPVELQINYEEYEVTTMRNGWEDYWASQERKRQKAVDIALTKPNEKFLIFCHDKGTGRDIVKRFEKEGENTVFHNADLPLKDRSDIENSFQDQNNGIRVLVSTSTLAMGVNLPARNVIIVGVHRGLTEVDELDIIQCAGRAGRYGIDDAGFVYLIIPETSTTRWQEIFKNPRPVNSVLNNRHILAFHVLAEVENRIINSVGSLLAWYKKSLAGMQNITPFDKRDAEGLITDLIKMEMLTGDIQRFSITGLGKVSAWLYFSPYDIYAWFRNLNVIFNCEMSDEILAWAIADIPSNDLGYIRKDLVPVCNDWKWLLKNRNIHVTQACPSVVGAYNCLNGINDQSFDSFKRTIIYDIDRQVQAFRLIDDIYTKWGKENFWKILPTRIKYGIPNEMVELVKVPGIGGVRARKLWDLGFKTIADVANLRNKKKLLNVVTPSMAKKVQSEARKLLTEGE